MPLIIPPVKRWWMSFSLPCLQTVRWLSVRLRIQGRQNLCLSPRLALPSVSGTLYLLLSDPDYPANSLYSIACANTGVFESATGYNKLLEL